MSAPAWRPSEPPRDHHYPPVRHPARRLALLAAAPAAAAVACRAGGLAGHRSRSRIRTRRSPEHPDRHAGSGSRRVPGRPDHRRGTRRAHPGDRLHRARRRPSRLAWEARRRGPNSAGQPEPDGGVRFRLLHRVSGRPDPLRRGAGSRLLSGTDHGFRHPVPQRDLRRPGNHRAIRRGRQPPASCSRSCSASRRSGTRSRCKEPAPSSCSRWPSGTASVPRSSSPPSLP